MDKGLISVNGTIYPSEEAAVPAMDRGLLFGDNVFEVLVGFGKTLLDVKPHLDRLRQSADNLEINIPWSDEELHFEMENLIEQIPTPKKYIRLVITRGNGLGLDFDGQMTPNKYMYAFPARPQSRDHWEVGVTMKVRKSNTTDRGANPKTGNYLQSILAKRSAAKEKFDDVLWTNAEGEVTEASTANVFFLGRDGDLVEVATPSLQSGILSGITRNTIIKLLNKAQIPVTERLIYADEIPRFDEAFICSTIRGMVPIRQVDNHKLHTTRPNGTFQHFRRLYDAWVASQLGYKVDWNTGSDRA